VLGLEAQSQVRGKILEGSAAELAARVFTREGALVPRRDGDVRKQHCREKTLSCAAI
jgi:hypothetical protein